MNSLDSPYNIYADLAQSSYHNRKNSVGVRYNFVNGMTKKQKRVLEKDKAIPFHFPNAKDAHGNDASIVYLQPDNTVKTIKEKNWVRRETVYKKGLSTQKKSIKNNQNSKEKEEFNYSLDVIDEKGDRTKGGQNLPNNGIVYLQPDNTVKTIKEKNWVGRETFYKKGLLTDEKAGYNSYYVTDTPTLSPKTQHTYFATRGSDGVSMDVKKVGQGII